MTIETTEDIQVYREFVQRTKEETKGRRLFRLNDMVENAVSCDELLELYDDLERAIRDKLVLGQELSALEKFAVRVVGRGICVW